ncbi:MAG TPA: MFS transporter [Gaiella sp.]|uniref:MFS transporter n=1 Tax=Gaiella sp. TaxID=2663207 RepID=UPI002D8113BB|nr:MFS transporter [Gaiella sp.]HET9285916.1 MFS transporter [Gaiella sp.]
MAGLTPATRPLRQRPVLALVSAEVISSLGSQMTFLALPWFVLQTTGSPTKMGVVLAAELAPIAVLGIPSGAVIARYGARRTMIVSDLARAPLIASIPLLHELGVLSFQLLLVIVACFGCFLAPYFASQRLILPELVGDDEHVVAQANAVVEGANRATSLLGPAAAGLLIAGFSAPVVLYVDAATFLCAFALLTLLVPSRPPLPQSDDGRGMLAGIRFLLRDRMLRVLGITALFTNGLGQMLSAGLTVLAYEEYSSSKVAGAFFAAFGVGAVLGSIAAVRIVGRHDPLRLGATAFVALTLPVFALSLELPVPAVMTALAASSFFGPLVNAPLIGVITMRTPEAVRAKVMTAVLTMAMLAGPVGMLVAGPLLESWGPRPVFLLVATGQLLATIPFALVAFGDRATEPAPSATA